MFSRKLLLKSGIFIVFFYLLIAFSILQAMAFASQTDDAVEITAAEELLILTQQGRLTVRALRAFGEQVRIIDRLTLEFRDANRSLLDANLAQIEQWISATQTGHLSLTDDQLSSLETLAQHMLNLIEAAHQLSDPLSELTTFDAMLPAPEEPVATESKQEVQTEEEAVLPSEEVATQEPDRAGFNLHKGGTDLTKLGINGEVLAIQDQPWRQHGSEHAGTQWSCLRDNETGLIWETGGGIFLDPKDPYPSDFYKHIAYVNAMQLCGFDDWRLPTIAEMQSILDHTKKQPAINTNYFLGPLLASTQKRLTWFRTSSFHDQVPVLPYIWEEDLSGGISPSQQPEYRWYVNINTGHITTYAPEVEVGLLLVRGEGFPCLYTIDSGSEGIAQGKCSIGPFATTASSDFTVIGDGSVVRHERTGLEWQRCTLGQKWSGDACLNEDDTRILFDIESASNIINTLYAGWRIPDIKELYTIVEVCHRPTINESIFLSKSGIVARAERWLRSLVRDDGLHVALSSTATTEEQAMMAVDFATGTTINAYTGRIFLVREAQ